MVKGVTKRVVVVRCPKTGCFDEAIFMVREGAVENMTPEEVLKEATAVADRYIRQNVEKKRSPWGYVAGGLGALGLIALGIILLVV